MIFFKKILGIVTIFLLCVAEGQTAIKDAIFLTIENKAITRSDIVKEIKTILILNGQTFSENNRDQLEAAALQSIIKRTVKKIEIDKYNDLSFNKDDVNEELKKLAGNVNVDLNTLKNTFVSNKINFSNVLSQIQTELLWNSLIFKLYKDRLSINIDEIDEQLIKIQNKKEIEEYLISEIIIKPVTADKLKSTIDELKKKIKAEGFEKVAIDESISESAIKGGNLGWINENIIADEFKSQIIKTSIGNISNAIILTEGILIFKVRDKRKIKNIINLEEAKNQLVNAEKGKILNMHSLSHYNNLRRSVTINYH